MFFKFKYFPYVRAIHVIKNNELVFKLANKCTEETPFLIGNMQYSIRALSDIGRQYLAQILAKEGALLDTTNEILGWQEVIFGEVSGWLANGLEGHILAVIPEKNLVAAVICDNAKEHPEAVELVALALAEWT